MTLPFNVIGRVPVGLAPDGGGQQLEGGHRGIARAARRPHPRRVQPVPHRQRRGAAGTAFVHGSNCNNTAGLGPTRFGAGARRAARRANR